MGKRRVAYTVLVGRPEGKSPLGRPRCKWEMFKQILKKFDEGFWTRRICLRAGAHHGLCVGDRARAFGFLKIQGIT
jgi:hypothetical protein